MQAIIFIGIPGSGKSTFYKKHFFDTHMRISMDLLNTRNKELKLMAYARAVQQKVVIDNTNPTISERKRYIDWFKEKKYDVIAYFFEPDFERSLHWNNQRMGKKRVTEVGIKSVFKKLERPTLTEGFDRLYTVIFNAKTGFKIIENS
ncbi:AAA family ATPase [Aureispira sp. CCB-E]|uniref:AAA family ATPase n=1 Tax=Aureispira sp. CCB-E TaxID=3051121 RepID=UPI002868746A|nr:AAA family ATPase [Aureispira sp. CCB-E]WMX14293.1 AAA family ATPase [Aureispira sp. CCB-E]